MYASCGWFFDDVAGLESSLVIRLAAHAVDLFQMAGGAPPVRDLLAVLAGARSNRREAGTGADIFRAMSGQRITGRHAIAHAALAELIGSPSAPTAGFRVEVVQRSAASSPAGPALAGRARAIDQRSGVVEDQEFLALRRKGAAFECRVGSQKITLADLRAEDRDALLLAALPRLAEEPFDLDVLRLALTAGRGVAPEGSGLDAATRRRIFGQMLVALLSRPRDELTAEALGVAADLHEAADLPPGSLERRVVEELVWEHLEEGEESAGMSRLAERLGFSPEAAPAEVIAS
jgi:hypothetical protein